MRSTLALVLLLISGAPSGAADGPTPLPVAPPEREEPVSYALEVSEVLYDRCIGCHSAALAENGLNLEGYAEMMKGGKSGPAILPGRAEESLLFRLSAHLAEPVMPPKDAAGSGPMTPKELGLLKLWIDAGSVDDTAAMLAEMKKLDAASIELGMLPPGVRPIVAVDVTADGRLVAAGRANEVFIYEVATGRQVARLTGHKDIIQSLRFRPDGRALAAGGYRVVMIWEAPEGDSGDEGEAGPGGWTLAAELTGHASRVLTLDYSPDGKLLAAGGGEPARTGEVKVWDVEAGAPVIDLPELHADTVFGVRFNPDGTRLATAAADRFVRILSLPDGEMQALFEGHTHHVLAVDWKSDGAQLVTGGADNVLKVWDVDKGEQLRTTREIGKQVTSLRWVPGSRDVLGASGDGQVRVWDPENGRIGRTMSGPDDFAFGVAASGDGKVVAAGGADGVLFLWDDQGKVLRSIPPGDDAGGEEED